MIVDMHCHLDLYPNPFEVAQKCKEKGVYTLSVTTTPKAWHGTVQLSEGNNRIRTALGLHPQLAHQRYHELELFNDLLPQSKYVGEIGLDGGTGFKDHWQIQLKVFRHILQRVNNAGGRIMSIHSRNSASSVIPELNKISGIPILHWFTGSKTDLKQAINIGCWFSVGPSMLATKRGQELTSMMPLNRVITETDGPFATVNKKPLMPWDAKMTYHPLSKIWKLAPSEVESMIKKNFTTLLTAAN